MGYFHNSEPKLQLTPRLISDELQRGLPCLLSLQYPAGSQAKANKMRNLFCILGLIGVILFVAGYYFVDNAKYAYISGIALMAAGFIGINKT